jgi:hypothetical protein
MADDFGTKPTQNDRREWRIVQWHQSVEINRRNSRIKLINSRRKFSPENQFINRIKKQDELAYLQEPTFNINKGMYSTTQILDNAHHFEPLQQMTLNNLFQQLEDLQTSISGARH